MLARSSAMPTRDGYAYEPKLDGFRCLICTEGAFQARSRRFWNMTPLLPELARFPVAGVFDGERIAFSDFRSLAADGAATRSSARCGTGSGTRSAGSSRFCLRASRVAARAARRVPAVASERRKNGGRSE